MRNSHIFVHVDLFFIDFSRRNSIDTGNNLGDSEFVVLKERKLVPTLPVFNGMLRFSFLLETCSPGSVPDAHLITALMDLVSCEQLFYWQVLF